MIVDGFCRLQGCAPGVLVRQQGVIVALQMTIIGTQAAIAVMQRFFLADSLTAAAQFLKQFFGILYVPCVSFACPALAPPR